MNSIHAPVSIARMYSICTIQLYRDPPRTAVSYCIAPDERGIGSLGRLRRCAFENIENGAESVRLQHATEIYESHDLCRVGVCTVRRAALRTPHLFGVGPSRCVRRPPSARSNAVLERPRPDHIGKHSRGAAMTTLRATAATESVQRPDAQRTEVCMTNLMMRLSDTVSDE